MQPPRARPRTSPCGSPPSRTSRWTRWAPPMSISCTTTRAALWVRRRDFGSETFWSDKIGAHPMPRSGQTPRGPRSAPASTPHRHPCAADTLDTVADVAATPLTVNHVGRACAVRMPRLSERRINEARPPQRRAGEASAAAASADHSALLRGGRSRCFSSRAGKTRPGRAGRHLVWPVVERTCGGLLLLRPVRFHPGLRSFGRKRAHALQRRGDQVLAAAICPRCSCLLPRTFARLAARLPCRGPVTGIRLVDRRRHGVGSVLPASVVAGLHDVLELSRVVIVCVVPVLCALPLAGPSLGALAGRDGACGSLCPHRADERIRTGVVVVGRRASPDSAG